MKVETIPCLPANCGAERTEPVAYLVVHYTAGDGDTARDNGRYFARCAVGASAHYFVDEGGVVASVPEKRVAWHCGAPSYRHRACRNGNSIGVELCSRRAAGRYTFAPETVKNALALLQGLLGRYGLGVEAVLRHYDVTGKICPAPFVDDQGAWQAFLEELEGRTMTQETFARQMDDYRAAQAQAAPGAGSAEARAWAEETGLLRGDSGGMRYKNPVTREELVEILYRMRGGMPHGDAE